MSRILFTGRSASLHAGIPLGTRGRHPLLPRTRGRQPPGTRGRLSSLPGTRGRHPFPVSRHPLEADTLPGNRHPPRSSACCEIRATSGRYASYWNAILYLMLPTHSDFTLKQQGNIFRGVSHVQPIDNRRQRKRKIKEKTTSIKENPRLNLCQPVQPIPIRLLSVTIHLCIQFTSFEGISKR